MVLKKPNENLIKTERVKKPIGAAYTFLYQDVTLSSSPTTVPITAVSAAGLNTLNNDPYTAVLISGNKIKFTAPRSRVYAFALFMPYQTVQSGTVTYSLGSARIASAVFITPEILMFNSRTAVTSVIKSNYSTIFTTSAGGGTPSTTQNVEAISPGTTADLNTACFLYAGDYVEFSVRITSSLLPAANAIVAQVGTDSNTPTFMFSVNEIVSEV